MSIQPIIQTLDKLVNVHKTLIQISEQKTEVLKEGSADKLQSVLIEEQKFIPKVERAEKAREEAVVNWFADKELNDEEQTITRILDLLANGVEKKQLEEVATTLTKAIAQLKQREQLNQALIQQSMQFINVSLNMLQPSMSQINYGRSKQNETSRTREHSVFDSKA